MTGPVPAHRYLVFAALALMGCAVDLATKSWAFGRLGPPGGPTEWLIPNVLGLQTSLNHGALFGLGQGFWWLFGVFSGVALVAILWWLFRARAAHDLLVTVALGFISAGVLGNLYDRLGLHGLLDLHGRPVHAVRDWVLLMLGSYHWPNFNLADNFLIVGAVLLLWHAYWMEPDSKTAKTA